MPIIATIIPWIGNITYVTGVTAIDVSPLYFSISMIFFLLAVYRYRLIEILPIAREEIIEKMDDAIAVLDDEGKIMDVNPSMEKILGLGKREIMGLKAEEVFSRYPDVAELSKLNKDFSKKCL